jgi:hypothetical protein
MAKQAIKDAEKVKFKEGGHDTKIKTHTLMAKLQASSKAWDLEDARDEEVEPLTIESLLGGIFAL